MIALTELPLQPEQGHYVSCEDYRLLQLIKEYSLNEFDAARDLRHCISYMSLMCMANREAFESDRRIMSMANYFYLFAHSLEQMLSGR